MVAKKFSGLVTAFIFSFFFIKEKGQDSKWMSEMRLRSSHES